MPSPSKSFLLPIRIKPGDIDELGHVNNVVYLRWVQDAAAAHWMQLAPPEIRKAYFWVVTRHEIDYKRPIRPDDHIIAETWVGDHQGARSDRYVRLRSPSGDIIYAEARTNWCLMSAATGRPTRLDESLIRILNGTGQQREK